MWVGVYYGEAKVVWPNREHADRLAIEDWPLIRG